MKTINGLVLVMVVGLAASGCTIHHLVADDYPEYLSKNVGSSELPKTKLQSNYAMTEETESNRYEFRAFVSGYANLWVVEFGKILDQTLQSQDVQNAFGRLTKSALGANGASGNLLLFELVRYEFTDFGAHVELKISLRKNGTVVLNKTYQADGRTQGHKMFWGGAFSTKNAIQQSTKAAIDDILRNLILDINQEENTRN